jgi:hypothetical protein
MALIACPECKREISDKAAACPHCGFDRKPKPATQYGCGTLIFLLLLIGILFAVLAPSTPTAPTVADTPAIAARKAKEEATFQKTVVFAAGVKRALRDPPSVVWETIMANGDASVICLEYRARNGFGGMSREFAVYADGKASQSSDAWNRSCAKKPLNDMIHVRQALN